MNVAYKHMGFTGTQQGCTTPQADSLKLVLQELREDGFLWMHNGDCVGADDEAFHWWRRLKGKTYLHPPVNRTHRAFNAAYITCEPALYLVRNRHIAESCHTLVATPQTIKEERRSGTWATVRMARELRRHICIIQPDGIVRWTRKK